MSPEMLMQPFEQTFNFVPTHNGQYLQHNNLIENNTVNMYYLGYPQQTSTDPNEDFRTAFYNPFEIKHRRRTSRAQLKILEKSFDENPKPNATVRRLLAQQLEMTPRGVQIWFQNRRAKAKLQRRKSGQEEDSAPVQAKKEEPNNSPALFNQFFNNLKAWDKNMRCSASLPPCPPLFNSFGSTDDENWLKTPLHPLAPVIESDTNLSMSSSELVPHDEWRRKSCPSLTPRGFQENSLRLSYQNVPWLTNSFENRRMTADNIPFATMTTESDKITTSLNSIGLYSNLNCSPLSQELTPMLSTGSPVSSVDGTCLDPCLDLLITDSSPSPSSAL